MRPNLPFVSAKHTLVTYNITLSLITKTNQGPRCFQVAAVVLVAEATRGRRCRVPRAPDVDRGFPYESGSRGAMLRGVPLPSGGRAFGPSDRGILQEILEPSLDTPPLGGGWFRHRSE
jgi:hypothetical protein